MQKIKILLLTLKAYMRPPYFVKMNEILQDFDAIYQIDEDVEGFADSIIIESILNLTEIFEDERILTRRLLQEYTNFITRNKLDRYNPTHDHGKLEPAQLESLKTLQSRIGHLLRYRLLFLHLIFFMLHHLGREKLEMGVQNSGDLVRVFLIEIKDMFDLITDDHTVVLFTVVDRLALRSYFKVAVGSLEKISLGDQYSSKDFDLERVKFLQTIVENYFQKENHLLNRIDFFIKTIYDISTQILQRTLDNGELDEIESLHTEEILIKKNKIGMYYYQVKYLHEKILNFLHKRQHRKTKKYIQIEREVLSKLNEEKDSYAGPRIDFLDENIVNAISDSVENQNTNLEFMEYATDLHEKMLAKEPLDRSLTEFYKFITTIRSSKRSAFSSTMVLPSIQPIILEGKEIPDTIKVKSIESMLETYSEIITENIISKTRDYVRIFAARETFSDMKIEDKVRLKLFLEEIAEIRASYSAIPPFIESQVGLSLYLEFFETLLTVDLQFVERLIPTLEFAFLNHLFNHAQAITYLNSVKNHPTTIKNQLSKTDENKLLKSVKQLEQIADQINGFVLTVSSSVELSLHWNIVEYEFVNGAVNDLITLLNTWDTTDINVKSSNLVIDRIEKIIEITDYLLSDKFLSNFPVKYLTSFHADMSENRSYFKLILIAYKSINHLIYGYNMTRQGSSVSDLTEKIEEYVSRLNIEEKMMSKPLFAQLAKLLTEVTEYANHIQFGISDLELMDQPIRNLVSTLLDCVISPIPH